MSALAIAHGLDRDLGGEPTLDELLTRVWEGLAAHYPAVCPVCGGEMTAVYGAHARQPDDSDAASIREAGGQAGCVPEGGRCRDCQTTIS